MCSCYEKTDTSLHPPSPPPSFPSLPPPPPPHCSLLPTAENHITTGAYTGQSCDEVSFEKGVVVKVMEKRLDGWWKVDYGGKVGFAQAIFLQRYDQEVDESKTTAIYMVPSLQEAVKQSLGGASSKGAEPTAKPRVSVTNEKSTIPKQRSAESVTPPTRKESSLSTPPLKCRRLCPPVWSSLLPWQQPYQCLPRPSPPPLQHASRANLSDHHSPSSSSPHMRVSRAAAILKWVGHNALGV